MRGGKRARAGRPMLPVTDHIQRGTLRLDRHAHALATAARPPAEAAWVPAPEQLAALGAAARPFVEAILADHELTLIDGERLLSIGRCIDRLSALSAIDRCGLEPKDLGTLDRLEIGWRALHTRLLGELEMSK